MSTLSSCCGGDRDENRANVKEKADKKRENFQKGKVGLRTPVPTGKKKKKKSQEKQT